MFQPSFGYAQHPKAGQNTQQMPSRQRIYKMAKLNDNFIYFIQIQKKS